MRGSSSEENVFQPQDSPYLANLAALWAANAELAATIETLGDEESYVTESSKAGAHTIALPCAGGGNIYLHSRYEPLEEAAKLAHTITTEDRAAFFIYGFALGYHVQALF